jgi:erythromycin esterase-like protein
MSKSDSMAAALAELTTPLRGRPHELDALVARAGEAEIVLIGEATHGTHEFYELRGELTRRLILEHGFAAVAAEADWPDAYRVKRWVEGAGSDETAAEALSGFERFPAWMWRNRDVLEFVDWLRRHNEAKPADSKVGFYGLDLYSLHASVDAVIAYLERSDPIAAREARDRYACFDPFGSEPEEYGRQTTFGVARDCQEEVVAELLELRARRSKLVGGDGAFADDDFFQAEQNARVVKNAEEYYRSMFRGRVSSWNLRDTHMVDTLDELRRHLGRRWATPKLVVWAHNSHVGDARATDMAHIGELNIGELVRRRHPGKTFSIGFSTYSGTVTAASSWGGTAERKRVRPGLPHSLEELFHCVSSSAFLLCLGERELEAVPALAEPRLQRAIGVIYKPESERQSHYFHVRLREQFDAMIHIDRSHALEPLEPGVGWIGGEAPETFPSGL